MVQVGRLKLAARAAREGEPAIGVVRRAAGLSQKAARRLFETGKVYLDGAPCLDWRTPVAAGAEVTVDTDRRAPRRLATLSPDAILHVDHSFVVVNKPPDIVSVPPTRTGEPTLLDLVAAELGQRPGAPRPVAVHRLDRETCGLMLFGLEGGDVAALRKQFEEHQVERAYYAVVEGTLGSGRLVGRIDVSRSRFGGGHQTRHAETEVEAVRTAGGRTLVICRPHTGRYHQLRIQLAEAGHPIVGEREHVGPTGTRAPRGARLALQSFSVNLRRPEDGRRVAWEIPLDPALAGLLAPTPMESP
jgi:RluA family pseudouridine synthase